MVDKTPRELLEECEKWERRHESLLEEYGLVARTLTPGERIESPKKPLTPEALAAIDEAEQKAHEAHEAYLASLR